MTEGQRLRCARVGQAAVGAIAHREGIRLQVRKSLKIKPSIQVGDGTTREWLVSIRPAGLRRDPSDLGALGRRPQP